MITIYALYTIRGTVRYVGKTKNVEARVAQHRHSNTNTRCSRWIRKEKRYSRILKYLILEVVTGDGNKEEREWIYHYRCVMGKALTNLTEGGEGTCGRVHSEATKEKMRKSAKGFSKEAQEALLRYRNDPIRTGIVAKNHAEKLRGKKDSLETRRRKSMAQTGRVCKRSTRIKLRNKRKGMKLNAEWCKNLSDSHYGIVQDRKWIEKRAKALRGKPWSKKRRATYERQHPTAN